MGEEHVEPGRAFATLRCDIIREAAQKGPEKINFV